MGPQRWTRCCALQPANFFFVTTILCLWKVLVTLCNMPAADRWQLSSQYNLWLLGRGLACRARPSAWQANVVSRLALAL